MEQLLPDTTLVEVEILKIMSSGYTVRVVEESKRIHKHTAPLHLPVDQEEAKFTALQAYANSSFSSLPEITQADSLNKIILFHATREKKYQRGFVEKLQDKDFLLVRNIDTRQLQYKMPVAQVRMLPEQFGITNWPPNRLQFTLAMVKPITLAIVDGSLSNRKQDSDKWDQAALDYVRRMTKDKIIVCKVDNMNPYTGTYGVMMWVQSNIKSDPVNVNESVIDNNFARKMTKVEETGNFGPPPSNIRTPAAPSTSNVSLSVPRKPDSPRKTESTTFNLAKFKRQKRLEPLFIGGCPVTPVSNILECNFYSKIEEQYRTGRGKEHTDLSAVQKYGWPLYKQGRDSVFVFPSDGTRRAELTFLIPILSDVVKGTFATLPKNYSPKVLIVVPSCKDADDIVEFCGAYLQGAMKHAIFVRKAYTISQYSPQAELWNTQDIIVTTPDALVFIVKRLRKDDDSPSKYYSNTCHVVLHKAHELFTHHVDSMKSVLNNLHTEINQREHARKCQITLFAHMWLPVFHKITQSFMSEPAVLLQNRTEAALFSGVKTVVEEYSTENSKLDAMLRYAQTLTLQNNKVVIFTSNQHAANKILEGLKCNAVPSYLLQEDGMNIQLWSKGCCMVVTDALAEQYVVKDCDAILHFDIPNSPTIFSNRLAYFEYLYTAIKTANTCLSCFFLDEEDMEKINNLVKYISRYGGEIPQSLREKAAKGEKLQQEKRSHEALCPYLRQYGDCTVKPCKMRHIVLEQDAPGTNLKILEIPLKGKIQVKITAVADGNRFYGQMISVFPGSCVNAEEAFDRYHQDLQTWFSNTQLCLQDETVLKEGLMVAVKDKQQKQFYRARIRSIHYNADFAGRCDGAKIRYVDTGFETLVKLEELYRMPDRQSKRASFCTELIVCGIRPAEHDQHFSSYCINKLRNTVIGEVLEGHIELALGNCLWIKTLEKRILLKKLKVRSSELSVRKLILDDSFGVQNPEHIRTLRDLVREALPIEADDTENTVHTTVQEVNPSEQQLVCISHINSPQHFYVNLVQNLDSLELLAVQINDDTLLNSLLPIWLPPKSHCLAKYHKDNAWYRGEVKRTWHDKYHVFFVDYGNEDTAVPSTSVKPIPPEFLEFPFQAVRCELDGAGLISEEWKPAHNKLFVEETLDLDMNMEILSSNSDEEESALSVSLVNTETAESVVEMLCRHHICINTSHLQNSPHKHHFYKLYKGEDDLELLSAADTLEQNITQNPVSCTEASDFVTLCRLCKYRIEEEDLVEHLLRAIVHMLQNNESLHSCLLKEGLLTPLIKKLSSISQLHLHIAHILSVVGKYQEVRELMYETQGIVMLCDLCNYKPEQSPKLLKVLGAVATLVTDNVRLCKEINATGHMRTLIRFIRDASDDCLNAALCTIVELCKAHRPCFMRFKDEGGVKEVCRALVRVGNPQGLLRILDMFKSEDNEVMSVLKQENVGPWLKKLKSKRRELHVKIMCDALCKKIATAAVQEEKENHSENVPDQIPAMIRVPITTPIDQPDLKSDIIKEPTVLWYDRKKYIGISIQIKDVGEHNLVLNNTTLTFETWNVGTHYSFRYKLFGKVTSLKKQIKKSEVLITLNKQLSAKWSSLLEQGLKKPNIKLDFSRAVDSEDETDSEVEEELPPKPVPCGENVEICIGGSDSDDPYIPEEDDVCDDFSHSVFRHDRGRNVLDPYDMDGLE